MRKFVFHHKKGVPAIVEVELEKLTQADDPSVGWLRPGEYKARILRPSSYHMKIERKLPDGSKQTIMEPDVWHSHAFYDSMEDVRAYAEKTIREGFEFAKRKHGTEYTEQEVLDVIAKIEVSTLT